MTERKWPVGRYAPGNYACKCDGCDQTFMGDKRATECHECVIQAQRSELERLRAELAALKGQEPVGRQHRFRDPDGPWSDWINGRLPSRAFDGVTEFEQRHIYAAPVPAVERDPEKAAEILKPYRARISANPTLQSLLYDADMMPEQTVTVRGAMSVVAVVEAYEAGRRDAVSSPVEQETGEDAP